MPSVFLPQLLSSASIKPSHNYLAPRDCVSFLHSSVTIPLLFAGDSTTDVRLLTDHHLVLATPQQWDMLSRRWKQRKVVQAVGLLIMDEMQLLGGQQGPVMEVRH